MALCDWRLWSSLPAHAAVPLLHCCRSRALTYPGDDGAEEGCVCALASSLEQLGGVEL